MFCKEEHGLFIDSNHLMDGPLCEDEPGPSLELLVKQQLTESGPRLMSAKGVGGESFCWPEPEPEVLGLRGIESPGETPARLPGQPE